MKRSPGYLCCWIAVGSITVGSAGYSQLLAQTRPDCSHVAGECPGPGTVVAADKRVQGRSYVFPETGEKIQYALFVPSNYDAAKKWPLIVGLHGAGRPYDWLMGFDGIIDFAQRDGFIMVTPLGYRALGGYGAPRPTTPPSPASGQPGRTAAEIEARAKEVQSLPANISELSEKDVMNVLEIVRKEFNVDPNRIYLWGHSMGGGGTYHLASTYPDVWAAVAVAAPGRALTPEQLERFKHVPILVLQGDADRTVTVERTRESVAKMQQVGLEHIYVEIKGGDHDFFISKNRETLSKVFSFFNIVQKSQRGPTN
jgi:poly(3-hydroxybutyrate) depolymerase